LDVIETAIRSAFEKGNAEDRDFREKVYRSAFAALDRALKANPGITVELAMSRRKNLQAKIAAIESEFIPAVPAMPAGAATAPRPAVEPVAPMVAPRVEVTRPREAPPVSVAPPEAAPAAVSGEAPPIELDAVAPAYAREVASPSAPAAPPVSAVPPVDVAPPAAARRSEPVEPDFDVAPEAPPRPLAGSAPLHDPVLDLAPDAERQRADGGFDIPPQDEPEMARERRRRPLAAFFVIVTLLALVGIGGWWAVQTGLLKLPSEIDTSVPNPPAGEEEDFDPDEEEIGTPALPGEADSRDWVSVFTPADPTLVSAPGDTSAEVMQDDSGSFIRIRSSTSGSAIIFDVGQGILERIAGKKAAFDIVARASEEGKETQISVICNFGELGDCGRKRYALTITKADYLFEIELPAGSPGAGGTIAINTDIEGGGKAIDVYEIKVAVSE
jgi:hypothetical protein